MTPLGGIVYYSMSKSIPSIVTWFNIWTIELTADAGLEITPDHSAFYPPIDKNTFLP